MHDSLPERPDLDQLRRRAKELRTAARAGDAAALDRSGWLPLHGVCMSRWHHIDPSRAAGMLEVARLLLDAGADPDAAAGGQAYCAPLFAAAGCADNPG
jgi:hypothetical protein